MGLQNYINLPHTHIYTYEWGNLFKLYIFYAKATAIYQFIINIQ
jgi:hypothetical protein